MNTTQHTLKTLAAVAVAAPLLVGCGQGGQSAEASTPVTSSATSAAASSASAQSQATPTASAATSAAAPGGAATGTPSTSPDSTGAPGAALPAVDDPCAGTCTETARVPVTHPTHGAMEIVAYERITQPDTAPQGKQPSYAVYQAGKAVGYVASPPENHVVSFGPGPVIGDQTWEVAVEPKDRYGNVYLSDSTGVTVISPTEKGYDSHGTMPNVNLVPDYPFQRAGLTSDAAGEPTVTVRQVDEKGMETGKTVNWAWDGGKFVAQK